MCRTIKNPFADLKKENILLKEKEQTYLEEIERLKTIECRYHQLVKDMDRYKIGGEGYENTKNHFSHFQ
jgi:hypothetical protein